MPGVRGVRAYEERTGADLKMVWAETFSSGPGEAANYIHWVQSEFHTSDFGEILSSSKALTNGGASFELTGVPETVAVLNEFMGRVP